MFTNIQMNEFTPILLLCALLAGCGSPAPTPAGQGVIFSASNADFAARVTGRKNLSYWTPTPADIEEATPNIKEFLEKQNPSIASRLQEYRCQYFGIVVEGKKRIFCNFFHRDRHDEDWQTSPLFVLDGGELYFQLEYNIETKQCLNFMVNGEA